LQSSTLVVCLLFFGIVGNWHVHAVEIHGAGASLLVVPLQDHTDGAGCPACSLGHTCPSELRPATSSVVERGVDRSMKPASAISDTVRHHADPSRAPPVQP
jgi:hypothetical protein